MDGDFQTSLPRGATESVFTRNVDWNLFKDFLELARHGGVGAAARAVGRQQPSMSAALKRLEAQLGHILCQRTGQGITLTPAGQMIAELSAGMANTVLSMPHRAAEAAGMLEGLISIRMISDVIAPVLDAALPTFHEIYPKVRVSLHIEPWRSVIETVLKCHGDLGVACDSTPRSDLRYLPIVRDTQQLYCACNSRLYGRCPGAPEDFADEVFVLTGADEPDELGRFRLRYGLGRRVAGTSETLQEARRLIELGYGIGFLPTGVAEPQVSAGVLWPLLPTPLLPSYQVYLITRAALPRDAPAARLFETVARLVRTDTS